MLLFSSTVKIKVVSEANMGEHPMTAYKRHKSQKKVVWAYLQDLKKYQGIPLTIKLVRLSPRKLDEHDNLRMAFKYIVDYIADFLNPGKAAGRADDSKLLKWEYDQEKGIDGFKGMRVELYGD